MTARPLLLVTIAYAGGIALSHFIDLSPWALLLAALFLLTSAAVLFLVCKSNSFPVMVAAFLFLGWAAAARDSGAGPGSMAAFLDKSVSIEGYICRDPDFRGDRTVYTLEAQKIIFGQQQSGAEGKILVHVPGAAAGYGYGDLISVRGRPYIPESPGNPGGFDYGEYLHDRGIWALMTVKETSDITKVGSGGGNPLAGAALGIKQRLMEINRATMEPGHAALINGMVFGGRAGIDPDTAEAFNESGVVHILSVSGLHVGFVVAAVIGLMGLAGLNRASFPVITAVLVVYTFITGMGPAVVRAALMAWVQLLGRHLGKDKDWPTTLAASALAILIFSPVALFEPGFQLSFGATWGILHLGPLFDRALARAGLERPWVRGSLSVSLGAVLGTLPLVAYHYYLISLISIPANLLAVPLVGLILPLSLVAGLAGLVFIKVAVVINYFSAALLELMLLLVKAVHQIPGGVQYVPSPHWVAMGLWYLSLLALPSLWVKRWKNIPLRLILVCLLAVFPALALLPAEIQGRGLLQVHVIDVGQGDSIFIRFPGGQGMLVDAGGRKGEFEKGRGSGEVVTSYLRRIGVRKLDALVLTHPHEDHAAGALYLLGRFDIRAVLIPPLNSGNQSGELPDPAYNGFLARVREKNILVQEIVCGDALSIDPGVRVDVLGPAVRPLCGTRSDMNNNSVVLSVRYQKRSFLLTGDIEVEAQQQLVESGFPLEHDVLKVSHHGSRYVSKDFIERVSPGLAVISVGRNSFGQPHPDTLELLEAGKVMVFRTDRDGLTVLVSDGSTIKPQKFNR